MAIALAIFGIAFAAFCVWLTVRSVNRRARWAKWTLAGIVVGLPMLYVASFGPACWAANNELLPQDEWEQFYQPMIWVLNPRTPDAISDPIRWYVGLWIDVPH